MDAYEATRIVFSRIQSLDPENASKIMGLLLIQDHGEKEMIRLAFGPEALVHSVVLKSRSDLGLSSNTPSTPSTPSSPSPFLSNSNSISISRQNSSSSSRILGGGLNLPSSLTVPNPSSSSSSWAPSVFSDLQNPDDLISPNSTSASYAAAVAAAAAMNGISNMGVGSSSSLPTTTSSSPFYGTGSDLIDEFQLQDQLSFLNDSSPTLGPKNSELFFPQPDSATSPSGSDAMLFPYGATNWGTSMHGHPHRRSCSVTDICLGSEEAGSGYAWKPCLYFARGYCKNGTSCRFFHGSLSDSGSLVAGDAAAIVGSPGKLDVVEQCQELLRAKTTQQQRLAAASQLMASASFPYTAASASKCMNFLLQQQQNDTQRAAAALMMGEDVHKFGRSRLERNDFPATGGAGMVNPGSRQIYLTFPADSTFREEDVSNYFSNYGPVQDVRIPYQQKRMFGFVTFHYPETVKLILAKGNPHFVCDARVLVKPYKEKGKVPDKYRHFLSLAAQQQQTERGDFSACTTPTGLDSRDAYDFQLGARMFYNTQDMLWRRKLEEQADLQQAIELQGRRLMGLQLLDVKKHHHHRNLSTGAAIPSPTYSPSLHNQSLISPSDRSSPEAPEENCGSPAIVISSAPDGTTDQQLHQAVNSEKESSGDDDNGNGNGNGNGKESPNHDDCYFHESLEHNLPDSPFASPTKSIGDHLSLFSTASVKAQRSNPISAASSSANNNLITSSILPTTSTLDMASFKSCFFQMPRWEPGHARVGLPLLRNIEKYMLEEDMF
ncbi:hypothetical protein HHK36_011855 [Tetracentron sinense]|uniref:Uncharacterized protein n=1 Tax=Tetracentron sinense TaxID=13715 RepID=A0A834ZCD3_TETSI|nr:hypothetical protein HHK36_011855 [Tetracentron sinense]